MGVSINAQTWMTYTADLLPDNNANTPKWGTGDGGTSPIYSIIADPDNVGFNLFGLNSQLLATDKK